MTKPVYTPDRGDIVWMVLDPRIGREQSGRRPALVLSRKLMAERTRLTVIMPITSKVKGLPYEIAIKSSKIDGAVLPLHIRSVDYVVRQAEFIEKAPQSVLQKAVKATHNMIG